MHFTFASVEALSAFSFALPLSLSLCPAKLVVVRSGRGTKGGCCGCCQVSLLTCSPEGVNEVQRGQT